MFKVVIADDEKKVVQLMQQMKLSASFKEKLTKLSVTEYYKLAVFRAWLWDYRVMILDLLVKCAKRGMAILLISSGADSIYEKTKNQEFRDRLIVL